MAGGGLGGRLGGRRSQMYIEARSSAGAGPGIQIATQSFVGNDAFRRSAIAETSPRTAQYCGTVTYVTHDKQL